MQIAISNFKVSHKKVFTNSNKLFKIWKILTSLKDIASAVTALLHTLIQYIEMVYMKVLREGEEGVDVDIIFI